MRPIRRDKNVLKLSNSRDCAHTSCMCCSNSSNSSRMFMSSNCLEEIISDLKKIVDKDFIKEDCKTRIKILRILIKTMKNGVLKTIRTTSLDIEDNIKDFTKCKVTDAVVLILLTLKLRKHASEFNQYLDDISEFHKEIERRCVFKTVTFCHSCETAEIRVDDSYKHNIILGEIDYHGRSSKILKGLSDDDIIKSTAITVLNSISTFDVYYNHIINWAVHNHMIDINIKKTRITIEDSVLMDMYDNRHLSHRERIEISQEAKDAACAAEQFTILTNELYDPEITSTWMNANAAGTIGLMNHIQWVNDIRHVTDHISVRLGINANLVAYTHHRFIPNYLFLLGIEDGQKFEKVNIMRNTILSLYFLMISLGLILGFQYATELDTYKTTPTDMVTIISIYSAVLYAIITQTYKKNITQYDFIRGRVPTNDLQLKDLHKVGWTKTMFCCAMVENEEFVRANFSNIKNVCFSKIVAEGKIIQNIEIQNRDLMFARTAVLQKGVYYNYSDDRVILCEDGRSAKLRSMRECHINKEESNENRLDTIFVRNQYVVSGLNGMLKEGVSKKFLHCKNIVQQSDYSESKW